MNIQSHQVVTVRMSRKGESESSVEAVELLVLLTSVQLERKMGRLLIW